MSELTLSLCSLSDTGVSHILNGKWGKLKSMNLGKSSNILGGNDFQEQSLCKIDKQKKSLIDKLDIYHCKVSGRFLFNCSENMGWENLK